MLEPVRIPISFFELVGEFERPDFRLLGDRVSIIQCLFDAMEPWHPKVEDIEVLTQGKLSEQGTSLKLALKRVTFFLGSSTFRFTQDDVTWDSATETVAILDALLSALATLSAVTVAVKKTGLAMHFQPLNVPFIEVLRPLISKPLESLENEPCVTMATVIKWPSRKITIDGSATLANAIFVRLEREFVGATTSTEMTNQLRRDQLELFRMLGVEEEKI